MHKWLSIIILLLAGLVPAGAQETGVSVEVATDQDQFIIGEDLAVRVRITNLSGQPLKLGSEPGWITFVIEGRERARVEKRGDPDLVGEFSLESGTIGTKRASLGPYFEFFESGRFQITALVKIPQWGKEISSKPKKIEINSGTTLREIEFGVPPKTNSPGQLPEMRKYILTQAANMKHLRLYARITDSAGGRTHTLVPIGPMVSFSLPEAQLDSESNLHIMSQTGARSFNYTVVTPEGGLLLRQTHDYTSRRPSLRVDREGRIIVHGGVRRPAVSDLPPVAAASTNAHPPVQTTNSIPTDGKADKP